MMDAKKRESELVKKVEAFVCCDFTPHFDELGDAFPTDPTWKRVRQLGTELWLDTGDVEAVSEIWTQEFTGLTTNNSLLNKEVRKGIYDDLITEASELLEGFPQLTDHQRKMEMAFILNARHALKLVELFDAHVSVEVHTDLMDDVEGTVHFGRRFHAICPERFIIKVPLSAAGLLAARRLGDESIRVNQTLAFSARQNIIAARIAHPAFGNVFVSRLNSFAADNGLSDGAYVGERAAVASQMSLRTARYSKNGKTRLIAASLRSGEQVYDLLGLDVLTIPPQVAKEFLAMDVLPDDLHDRSTQKYYPVFAGTTDARAVGIESLWNVDGSLLDCLEKLDHMDLSAWTADCLIDCFSVHGCGDAMVRWSDQQRHTSAEEGKIPNIANWMDLLTDRKIGLDSLMTLAGWNSFNADQCQMDRRVQDVLEPEEARSPS